MKISKNKETPISNAYDCFSYWYPISKNNRKNLIDFFENNRNIKLWWELFSKVFLLIWNENSLFIESFLRAKWYDGVSRNDSSKFIEYVLSELENYPFLVDIEYDEIREIKDKPIDNNTKIYIYKKENQKWILITNKSWETFVLDKTYEKLDHRKNWIFCWIKKEWKTSFWEYIQIIWNKFKVIWKIENIIDIPNISDKDWNIIYRSSPSWKKWLSKIEEKKRNSEIQEKEENLTKETEKNTTKKEESFPIEINHKIRAEYDSILIINWLVLGCKDLPGKDPNIKIQKIDIYSKEHKKILVYESVENFELVEWLNNIFRFKTDNWHCYYEIKDNWEIKAVSFLQNVKTLLRPNKICDVYKNLELWKPVFIKYKWSKSCMIIKDENDKILSHTLDYNKEKNSLTSLETWLDKNIFSTYLINWIPYIYNITTKILYIWPEKFKPVTENTLKSEFKTKDFWPLELN
jgi:hypothetical protein